MTVECAGDTELGLNAHDSSLHVIEGTGYLRRWERPPAECGLEASGGFTPPPTCESHLVRDGAYHKLRDPVIEFVKPGKCGYLA